MGDQHQVWEGKEHWQDMAGTRGVSWKGKSCVLVLDMMPPDPLACSEGCPTSCFKGFKGRTNWGHLRKSLDKAQSIVHCKVGFKQIAPCLPALPYFIVWSTFFSFPDLGSLSLHSCLVSCLPTSCLVRVTPQMLSWTADNRENRQAASVVRMLFLFSTEKLPLANRALSSWPRLLAATPDASPGGGYLPPGLPVCLFGTSLRGDGAPILERQSLDPPQPTPFPVKAHGPVGSHWPLNWCLSILETFLRA